MQYAGVEQISTAGFYMAVFLANVPGAKLVTQRR